MPTKISQPTVNRYACRAQIAGELVTFGVDFNDPEVCILTFALYNYVHAHFKSKLRLPITVQQLNEMIDLPVPDCTTSLMLPSAVAVHCITIHKDVVVEAVAKGADGAESGDAGAVNDSFTRPVRQAAVTAKHALDGVFKSSGTQRQSSSAHIRGGRRGLKPEHIFAEDIADGKESRPIVCVNEFTEARLPTDFEYLALCEPSKGVMDFFQDVEPAPGCGCTGMCKDYSNCRTLELNNGTCPYNDESFLFERQIAVYECNDNSQCSHQLCPNRVVQKGISYNLEVFMSPDGRGWGLRARELIYSGSFIMEYNGEVRFGMLASLCPLFSCF
jgi:hypothetical protein